MIKYLFKNKINDKFIPGLKKADVIRLSKMQRFEKTTVNFMGHEFIILDAPTFLSSCNEIINQEIYKFSSAKDASPVIIDCGANVGIATLYFKLNYPKAQILAFEPDPNLFAALRNNIDSFHFKDVKLYNEAIGVKEEILLFNMEGGHSGMLVTSPTEKTIPVSVIPLKDVLAKFYKIDFLKIDIEGHEINVLPSIKESLGKVNNLFLEYHSFIDQPQQLSIIVKIIEEAGFRYYIKEAAYKKNPFLELELFYKMDMLVNIFCYRL